MKKLGKRLLLYLFLAASALAVTYLPEIYSKFEPYRLIRDIELRLGKITGRKAHVSDISIGFEKGLAVRAEGIYVVNGDGGLFARVEKAYMTLSVLALARGKLAIEKAKIRGATIRLYRDDLAFGGGKESTKSPGEALRSVLANISAESVEQEDVWVMVCPDEKNTMVSDCYSATIERSEISLGRKRVDVDAQIDVRTPWYMEPVKSRVRVTLTPSREGIGVSARLSASVKGLSLWDKWKSKSPALPEMEGAGSVAAQARYGEGTIGLMVTYSTGNSTVGFGNRRLELKNAAITQEIAASLSFSEVSADINGVVGFLGIGSDGRTRQARNVKFDVEVDRSGRTFELRPSKVTVGQAGRAVSLWLRGAAESGGGRKSFFGVGLPFSKGDIELRLEAGDLSTASEAAGGPARGWNVGGRAGAGLRVKLEKGRAEGNFEVRGKGLEIEYPAFYGDRAGLAESVTATGEFSLSTRELVISGLSVALGGTKAEAEGRVGFTSSGIGKILANVELPVAYYSDVMPLLPRGKMKGGAGRFFFHELEEAKVADVIGRIRWNPSSGGGDKREFLRKGVTAGGNIESARMNFGSAAIDVSGGKVSLYRGALSFFDIAADIAGSRVGNMRADIESLGKNALLVLYPKDKFRAESLLAILQAPGLGISDVMRRVRAEGEMNPSGTVVEIPLRKGSSPSMGGVVALNGVSLSMAGLLPLMEDIRGEVTLEGAGVSSNDLDFSVAGMKMSASLRVDDISKPEGEVRVSCDKLFPQRYFEAIPPFEEEKKPGSGRKREANPRKTAIRVFLKSPAGEYKTFRFQNLTASMVVGDDAVRFEKMRLVSSGGKISTLRPAMVKFDGPEPIFRVEGRGLDPSRFLESIGVESERVSGELRFDGLMYSRGNTMDQILGNLNGRMGFRIKEGRIESSGVLFQIFDILNFDLSKWKARRLGYRQIRGELFFDNGRVEIVDITVNGFFLRIAATGWVDLDSRKMEVDMGLVPLGSVENLVGNTPIVGRLIRASSGKSLFAYYFRVKGPLDDYKVVQLGPEGVKDKIDDIIKGILAGFR